MSAGRIVADMIAHDALPGVIVNPSAPVGPRDVRPTPTGRIIVEAASGKVPGFVDTGLNLVHVDDVADGHLAALRRGKIGERYILGGENVSFARMLGDIAGLAGRRPPRFRVPHWAVLPVAYGSEAIACVTGRAPFGAVEGRCRGFACPGIACFSRRPRPRRSSAIAAVPISKGSRMRCAGFARRATWGGAEHPFPACRLSLSARARGVRARRR